MKFLNNCDLRWAKWVLIDMAILYCWSFTKKSIERSISIHVVLWDNSESVRLDSMQRGDSQCELEWIRSLYLWSCKVILKITRTLYFRDVLWCRLRFQIYTNINLVVLLGGSRCFAMNSATARISTIIVLSCHFRFSRSHVASVVLNSIDCVLC